MNLIPILFLAVGFGLPGSPQPHAIVVVTSDLEVGRALLKSPADRLKDDARKLGYLLDDKSDVLFLVDRALAEDPADRAVGLLLASLKGKSLPVRLDSGSSNGSDLDAVRKLILAGPFGGAYSLKQLKSPEFKTQLCIAVRADLNAGGRQVTFAGPVLPSTNRDSDFFTNIEIGADIASKQDDPIPDLPLSVLITRPAGMSGNDLQARAIGVVRQLREDAHEKLGVRTSTMLDELTLAQGKRQEGSLMVSDLRDEFRTAFEDSFAAQADSLGFKSEGEARAFLQHATFGPTKFDLFLQIGVLRGGRHLMQGFPISSLTP